MPKPLISSSTNTMDRNFNTEFVTTPSLFTLVGRMNKKTSEPQTNRQVTQKTKILSPNDDKGEWQTIAPKKTLKKPKFNENDNVNVNVNVVQQKVQKNKPVVDEPIKVVKPTVQNTVVNTEAVNNIVDDTLAGKNLKFKNSYKLWIHKEGEAWDITGFDDPSYVVDSVGTFLEFFCNIQKYDLSVYSFYFMKMYEPGKFVEPTWEHFMNRDGSTCSIRIDAINGLELFTIMSLLMFNNVLIPNMDLVNGISVSKKTNWILIKLWIKEGEIDLPKLLPYGILTRYPNLDPRSKKHIPEY